MIYEEVSLAFQAGLTDAKLSNQDIHKLISCALHEYPTQFMEKSAERLLDLVWTLSKTKTKEFRSLMSRVNCQTESSQYAQWLLAIRSFTLISMVSAVINFYRKLAVDNNAKDAPPPLIEKSAILRTSQDR